MTRRLEIFHDFLIWILPSGFPTLCPFSTPNALMALFRPVLAYPGGFGAGVASRMSHPLSFPLLFFSTFFFFFLIFLLLVFLVPSPHRVPARALPADCPFCSSASGLLGPPSLAIPVVYFSDRRLFFFFFCPCRCRVVSPFLGFSQFHSTLRCAVVFPCFKVSSSFFLSQLTKGFVVLYLL